MELCADRIKWDFEYWGKPLILVHRQYICAPCSRTIMFSLIAQVARFFRPASEMNPSSPAAVLMESAGSRVGLDAHQAQELRAAASAWLSVVR